jgi:NMD protein affecting ribosome stability and mRNA decay
MVENKNKCKKCGKEVEYAEFDLCKSCYYKEKGKKFKCQDCGTEIDGHNYYFHQKLCDGCYEKMLDAYFRRTKEKDSV